ncbi:hypothetical protein [Staphylococcus pseudoxylosus]|uniref:hypothetical protein n=1 Tax=Staphylococcus pseudoxylosus TaxID=2282419 RepID=UPI00398B1D88
MGVDELFYLDDQTETDEIGNCNVSFAKSSIWIVVGRNLLYMPILLCGKIVVIKLFIVTLDIFAENREKRSNPLK